MICPNCKNEIENSSKYCKYCGKELQDAPKKGKWVFFAVIGVVIAVVLIGFFLMKNHLIGNNSSDLKRSETTDTKSLSIGDSIFIGHYEQDGDSDETEEIEWIILDNEGDKALIISKYALDCIPFNNESGDIKWNDSTIRNWLNGIFFESAFSPSDRAAIILTKNANIGVSEGVDSEGKRYIANENNKLEEVFLENPGSGNTDDSVFLLSVDEANGYLNDNKRALYTIYAKNKFIEREIEYAELMGADTGTENSEESRKKCETWYDDVMKNYDTNQCYCYWLRSVGSITGCASIVDYTGAIQTQPIESAEVAIRPAMYVDLSKIK